MKQRRLNAPGPSGHAARTFVALVLLWGAVLPEVGSAQAPASPPPRNGSLPAVSPDGSHIAFVSNRGGSEDLFVIAADGTGEKQLTHTPDEKGAVGWTANGKQIVFSVFANDASRLFAIRPDGKHQREIGHVPGRSPMLSPDGKKLLYMAGTWTATQLMVSALDGSQARQVPTGSPTAWNNHWSPDGKRIAFTGRDDSNGKLAVFVMNADGTERRQVTHFTPEEGAAQWPVWSPDGRRLAIQVNVLKTHSACIWVVELASGKARELAAHEPPYLDETPSWFPDGKRIAFQSDRTERMEVWVMNADGSEPRQVTGGATAP